MHVESVAGKYDTRDVLSYIVHIALDGRQDNSAALG